MGRTSQLIVLVTAFMSLFAVLSSATGAVTWHNTGNTSFTATGGSMSLSVGGSSFGCSSSDATGVSPVTTTTNVLATGMLAFTGCTLIGIPMHINCSYTFTAASASLLGVIDVHCLQVTTLTGARCTITGATPVTYTNPVSPTRGRLHLLHSASLALSVPPTGGSCPFSGAGATLTAQMLTITAASGGVGTLGPIFTRTA